MITIHKQLTISDKVELYFKAQIKGNTDKDKVILNLFSDQINFTNIEGYDFFDALVKLRRLLEDRKLFILCQGSAKNVYPSRMIRDMSSGLKAYVLKLGKKTSIDNLVEIFDPASVEVVGLISEQIMFFEQWVAIPKD